MAADLRARAHLFVILAAAPCAATGDTRRPADTWRVIGVVTADMGRQRFNLRLNRCVNAHREIQVGADEVPARPRLFRPGRDDAPAGGETPPTTIRLALAAVAVVMEAV